jgi:hypothetical protein
MTNDFFAAGQPYSEQEWKAENFNSNPELVFKTGKAPF